ncbi:hypothetical protein ACLKA7_009202 [Drosophila subpalustris]
MRTPKSGVWPGIYDYDDNYGYYLLYAYEHLFGHNRGALCHFYATPILSLQRPCSGATCKGVSSRGTDSVCQGLELTRNLKGITESLQLLPFTAHHMMSLSLLTGNSHSLSEEEIDE